MTTFINGAEIDTRTEEEKEKDYTLDEIVASASPVNWETKTEYRKFPIYNQNGSGSCVAQTQAKEMGIMRSLKDGIYVHFSATDIYQRRKNRPASGMHAVDAREILRKGGATLESLTPSQKMTDREMDEAFVAPYKRSVGEVFKVPNYVSLPTNDIDSVASTIQATGKGVMVWHYFNINEWTEKPKILDKELKLNQGSTLRHSVTAVDYTLIDGVKHLVIEDSWGPGAGSGGQRVISEVFHEKRNFYAGYLINFRFETDQVDKPEANFKKDLYFGQFGPDVTRLQDCLKFEGLFPTNVDSTGYYGSVTQQSVQKYQLKHAITTKNGPGYGRVGPKTRKHLNFNFF